MRKINVPINDVIKGIHQDYMVNFLSIHDETVQISDKFLFKPIMRQFVKIAELPQIFSKTQIPFIQFKFDVEYDEWGSYTSNNKFEVYEYDVETLKLLKEKGFSKNNVDQNVQNVKKDKKKQRETISVTITEEDTDKIRRIDSVKSGNVELYVFFNDEKYKYERLVDIDEIKTLFNLQ